MGASRTTWEAEWRASEADVKRLSSHVQRERTSRGVSILRVNQLDAQQLDEELHDLLRAQVSRGVSLFPPRLATRLEPEIDALVDSLVFLFSIATDTPSPGNKLQNIQYRNEHAAAQRGLDHTHLRAGNTLSLRQKILCGLIIVGGRWAWKRTERLVAEFGWGSYPAGDWRRSVWVCLQRAELLFKVLSLVNFLVFLREGKYRSLLDRVLGMRLVYIRPLMARHVSFEFMNRQLVWHGFTEFLLFLLPFIDLRRTRTLIQRLLPQSVTHTNAVQSTHVDRTCPLCKADPPSTPYRAQCGHLFCYYCLRASCMADPAYACPRCGQRVVSMQRWKRSESP